MVSVLTHGLFTNKEKPQNNNLWQTIIKTSENKFYKIYKICVIFV